VNNIKNNEEIPEDLRKELQDIQEHPEKYIMKPLSEHFEMRIDENGNKTFSHKICDGEVNIGPFKSCLKEFTGVSAIGWVAVAAGLIVLWKWLDYRFRK
jgi:hypothetical protein